MTVSPCRAPKRTRDEYAGGHPAQFAENYLGQQSFAGCVSGQGESHPQDDQKAVQQGRSKRRGEEVRTAIGGWVAALMQQNTVWLCR